jgi:putative colanic acid biosynthesis acetyltransferase WcaF
MNKKTDLSIYDNSWYNPGSKLKIAVWYFVNYIFFQSYLFPFSGFKSILLRIFGAKVGKGVVIKPAVNIKYPWFLEIGNYVWIGEKVWIDCIGNVTIGDNSCISQGALIISGNHNYKKTTFDLVIREIVIEDGVWIGAKSVVCQGVKCASHSLLTVGSIATQSLLPYSIYQGNPAVKIRDRIVK